MLLLAIVGTGIAAYLTYVALWEEGNAFCTGIGDCKRVQQSEYARVGPFPVASFGLAMYLGMLLLLAVRRWRPATAARRFAVWTFTLALGGVVYSGYLTWLELVVIQAICVWCVGSAAVVTGIFLLALPDVRPQGRP